jgi:hypothetical protein
MQARRPFLFNLSALALASALMLTACGGGGGGTATVSTGAATPTKSSLYAGPVQGFGSVIVNGMRFSSVGATLVDDDGVSVNLRDLKLGMTVRIDGSADDSTSTGTATNVELVHGTRGTITAIDTTAKTITLLGQTIKVDDATVFQGAANLAALTVGQAVEIYGAVQSDGSVLATLVEVKTITAISLSGVVSNLTSTNFKIGTLTVTLPSDATKIRGTLADGARVKVKAAPGALSGNVLTATSVQVLGAGFALGTTPAAGALLKIKGLAAAAPVNGVLTLSGTPIDISKATFEGGTAASIATGSFLEVKGTWDGTTLQATKVEFEGAREARIGGRNELYGAVSSITGNIAVVNGVTVDLSTAVFSHGNASQVVVGSYVEIQGNVVGDTLVAKKVELKSGTAASGMAFEQSGTVSNFVSLSNFKLGGLTVNAATATLESKTGSSTIANGSYIEITGKLDANNVFVATKVELK